MSLRCRRIVTLLFAVSIAAPSYAQREPPPTGGKKPGKDTGVPNPTPPSPTPPGGSGSTPNGSGQDGDKDLRKDHPSRILAELAAAHLTATDAAVLKHQRAEAMRFFVDAVRREAAPRCIAIGDSLVCFAQTPADASLPILLSGVRQHRHAGARDIARRDIEKGLKKFPNSWPLHAMRQDLARGTDAERDLLRSYRTRSKKHAGDPVSKALLARMLAPASARSMLKTVVRTHPKFAAAWIELAFAHAACGRGAEAQAAAQRGVALEPHAARAHEALGVAHTVLHAPGPAESAFRESIRLDPLHLPAYQRLARLLVDESRIKEARATLEQALRAAPRAGELWVQRGVLEFSQQSPRKAEAALRKGLEKRAHDVAGTLALGYALARNKRLALATQTMERARALEPRSARVLAANGFVAFGANKWDIAADAYRRAARRDTKNTRHLLFAGLAYRELNNMRQATSFVRRAASRASHDSQTGLALGSTLEKTGKRSSARRAYRAVTRKTPECVAAWVRLGFLAANQRQYKRAHAALERAIAVDRDNLDALLARGLVEEGGLGRFDAALATYKRYRKLGGKDKRVKEWIARVAAKA